MPIDKPAAHRLGVVVDAPQHSGLCGALDYLSDEALPPGTLVRVPLGRRVVTGVVWEDGGPVGDAAHQVADLAGGLQLKPIAEVLAGLPPLPASWRRLVAFASGYYQRALGEMALMVLPPELRQLDALQWARRLKRLEKALAPPAEPKA